MSDSSTDIVAMPSPFEHSLQYLKAETYCLWIGAGVPIHLGAVATGRRIPSWDQLVRDLEKKTGVPGAPENADFPTRIEVCSRHLDRMDFQAFLREALLDALSNALVEGQDTHGENVPEQARQLAHLGMLANPIVNFNIESLSSAAVAGPAGPWSARVFRPPTKGPWAPVRFDISDGGSEHFQRHVYHPHGAIDISGSCVMSSSEYRSMQGTLAFQVATHAAFDQNLAIVGMSLQDAYLREQLELFRDQVRKIYYFTTNAPTAGGPIAEWIWRNGVQVIEVPSWSNFWAAVLRILPGPEEIRLRQAWQDLLSRACNSRSKPLTRGINEIMHIFDRKPEEIMPWIEAKALQGEKGELKPEPPTKGTPVPASIRAFRAKTFQMLSKQANKG